MSKTSERQTRADRLADQIADAILVGDLKPGERLDEQSLADRYRVSRTPVREALRQLGASGLIEARPRRGATVAHITPAKLQELFVAMGEVEATCARLDALRMTPLERRRLAALQASMGEIVARNDFPSYVAANDEFHNSIYAGAHNEFLRDMALGLRRRLAPFRRAQFRAPGRLARSLAEHGLIVNAIAGGDANAAHAAMLHHVSLVEETFDQLVSSSRPVPAKSDLV